MTGGKHHLPPIHNGGKNMSLDKKLNILLILTSLGYGLLLAIMIFGAIFPGEPSPIFGPWYVLAAVGEVVAFMIATLVTCLYADNKCSRHVRSVLQYGHGSCTSCFRSVAALLGLQPLK